MTNPAPTGNLRGLDAAIGAAWHEYTYPRVVQDSPPERFQRAVRTAVEVATARETALRSELDIVEAESGKLTHRNNQVRAERDALQARLDAVLAVCDDFARPFPDGVPDREGEDAARIVRAAALGTKEA